MTGHMNCAARAGFRPDFQAQRMGFFDCGKIKIATPYKGYHLIEELRSSLAIPGTNPCFDKGSPLPCAAQAFIIVQRRAHRDANRCHRRIRPQAKIRAKNIAVLGNIIEQFGRRAGRTDQDLTALRGLKMIHIAVIKHHHKINI